MIKENVKQKIKFSLIMVVIAITISIAIFAVVKYEVEGEKNMPFNLGKIIVISSASTTPYVEEIQQEDNVKTSETQDEQAIVEGGSSSTVAENQSSGAQANSEQANATQQQQVQGNESNQNVVAESQAPETQANSEQTTATEEKYIWEENVVQTNDVYIYLDKNVDFKEDEVIKSVRIENIKILKNVNLGKIQVYMPNSLDDGLYKYKKDFLVNATLTYKGATADNKKTLEVGNQGGCICLSFANTGIGVYKSNEDEQIEQGAYILEKMNIANEDLKFKVSFDLVIEVSNKSYKGTVTLDMPAGDIVGQKECHVEITNFDDVVFKRF